MSVISNPSGAAELLIRFGASAVSLERREVTREGAPVGLGARAFDILAVLLAVRGTLVSKDELIRRVWPGRVIEENTLEAQVSALRRALGADRDAIRTVSGRGYQFVAAIHTLPTSNIESSRAGSSSVDRGGRGMGAGLPIPLSSFIARDGALRDVIELAKESRLLTLVGTGGVGKTRLALEAGRCLNIPFHDGVFFADLAPISNEEFVPMAIARALGLPPGVGTASMDLIAAAVQAKRLLLIVDNCEHLIDACARAADALLTATPGVHLMATSREPLRVDGEYIYRVSSLAFPGAGTTDVAEILRQDSVQLFQARMGARGHATTKPADSVAIHIGRICRRLDGIPLAIELAAAQASVLGPEELAKRLDDRFMLLSGGKRTALPRQQTLRATLDWSYELLPADEQVVLRRLSVFAGPFPLDAASAVASSDGLAADHVVACVARLADKSLVSFDGGSGSAWPRLLETTQIYAREKLCEAGEQACFADRHARFVLTVMEDAEQQVASETVAGWTRRFEPWLDNVRAALQASFASDSRSPVGVALTAAAVPLWQALSLYQEFLRRVDLALDCLDGHRLDETAMRMKLRAARGAALVHHAPFVESRASFEEALALAEQLDDADYQFRCIWGLWSLSQVDARLADALSYSNRFAQLAEAQSSTSNRIIALRLRGLTELSLGHLDQARSLLERMLASYEVDHNGREHVRFVFDQRMMANCALAHVLWLQGHAAQARQTSRLALDIAVELDHQPSLCFASTEAAAIALHTGGVEAAAAFVPIITRETQRTGLPAWQSRARLWKGFIDFCRGDDAAYVNDMKPVLDLLGDLLFCPHSIGLLCVTALHLARSGQYEAGLEIVRRGLAFSQRSGEGCYRAEWLRSEGDVHLYSGNKEIAGMAQASYRQAIQVAHEAGMASFELRAAVSLTSLLVARGETQEVRALLFDRLARVKAGGQTIDTDAADKLLALAA